MKWDAHRPTREWEKGSKGSHRYDEGLLHYVISDGPSLSKVAEQTTTERIKKWKYFMGNFIPWSHLESHHHHQRSPESGTVDSEKKPEEEKVLYLANCWADRKFIRKMFLFM